MMQAVLTPCKNALKVMERGDPTIRRERARFRSHDDCAGSRFTQQTWHVSAPFPSKRV
jgi:hypothetical protein